MHVNCMCNTADYTTNATNKHEYQLLATRVGNVKVKCHQLLFFLLVFHLSSVRKRSPVSQLIVTGQQPDEKQARRQTEQRPPGLLWASLADSVERRRLLRVSSVSSSINCSVDKSMSLRMSTERSSSPFTVTNSFFWFTQREHLAATTLLIRTRL